jgi:hypothetical protein
MVFNTLTGKFEKQYSVDGTDLDMVINNKIYSITLPKPEMWP